jgi:tRNA nucleotidyltransferase (CCA-adding enzyme)
VGGALRDELLGRAVTDIDIAVEGDPEAAARELAKEVRGPVFRLSEAFGAWRVVDRMGGRVYDFAPLQGETIEEDLARRDFAINAMAMEIARARAPRLLDPFDGRGDLRRRIVRMLHPGSPLDDPTRSFRAVRYANRLGFEIDARTRRWIRDAVGAVDAVSGDRIRRELALLLSERNRAAAARELSRLGVATAVHSALRFDRAASRRLANAERLAEEAGLAPGWIVYLLSWMGEIDRKTADAVAARLNLRKPTAEDAMLAAAAGLPLTEGRRRLRAHLAAAAVRLSIRGSDLVAAGVAPGPAIGRALSATLAARRVGSIRAEEELSFAVKAARS